MKKLILVIMVLACLVGSTIAEVKAWVMPSELPDSCTGMVWNAASQLLCYWELMIEVYGYGEWPI